MHVIRTSEVETKFSKEQMPTYHSNEHMAWFDLLVERTLVFHTSREAGAAASGRSIQMPPCNVAFNMLAKKAAPLPRCTTAYKLKSHSLAGLARHATCWQVSHVGHDLLPREDS